MLEVIIVEDELAAAVFWLDESEGGMLVASLLIFFDAPEPAW